MRPNAVIERIWIILRERMSKRNLLVASLILAALPLAEGAEDYTNRQVAHFLLQIPSSYIVKDLTPQFADFELFEICEQKRETACLKLYFGNFPNFPLLRWNSAPSVEGASDRQDYPFRTDDGAIEGLLSYRGLTYKNHNGTPYSQIHYFSKGLSKEQAARFLEIANSVKVTRPNLD